MSWFKKKEEPLTMEKVIQFLQDNSEQITNKQAEKILVIVVKSPANKIIEFRVQE